MSETEKLEPAPSTKRGNNLIFEQAYLQSRVIEKADGVYNIEMAMLDGPSITIDEPSEIKAKAIYAGLDKAYRAGVRELQEKMRDALSKIQDDASQSEPD